MGCMSEKATVIINTVQQETGAMKSDPSFEEIITESFEKSSTNSENSENSVNET